MSNDCRPGTSLIKKYKIMKNNGILRSHVNQNDSSLFGRRINTHKSQLKLFLFIIEIPFIFCINILNNQIFISKYNTYY